MDAVIKIIAFLAGLLCLALCDMVLQKRISHTGMRMIASFCLVVGAILLAVGITGLIL